MLCELKDMCITHLSAKLRNFDQQARDRSERALLRLCVFLMRLTPNEEYFTKFISKVQADMKNVDTVEVQTAFNHWLMR